MNNGSNLLVQNPAVILAVKAIRIELEKKIQKKTVVVDEFGFFDWLKRAWWKILIFAMIIALIAWIPTSLARSEWLSITSTAIAMAIGLGVVTMLLGLLEISAAFRIKKQRADKVKADQEIADLKVEYENRIQALYSNPRELLVLIMSCLGGILDPIKKELDELVPRFQQNFYHCKRHWKSELKSLRKTHRDLNGLADSICTPAPEILNEILFRRSVVFKMGIEAKVEVDNHFAYLQNLQGEIVRAEQEIESLVTLKNGTEEFRKITASGRLNDAQSTEVINWLLVAAHKSINAAYAVVLKVQHLSESLEEKQLKVVERMQISSRDVNQHMLPA